ncbi:MAG: hypothetical protein DI626_03970 [Micavibrio aeruginosavorus]|uniref:Uncharacterized protein n=1 Tax=Micavibrio aeruginosavorus TaxID=349221 RepID=A0A2W4ZYN3_9BACT|nr:MAG: hypothetical protein DI626_03970 [Micavibrio aeruginosavorus]
MMRVLAVCLCIAVLSAGGASFAFADDGKPPKELVEELSKVAHDGFLTVKNPQGQTIVKPEDAKKLKFPIINYEEREKAVARGYLSATAKWCGLKWEQDYFKPYVKSLQVEHGKKWTPHQYAYAEVLHGVAMGVETREKKGEKCSDAEKKRVAALAKK